MPLPNDPLEELVRTVQASAKYRDVCEAFVRRLGAQELAKRRTLKEAVKAVKNALHQATGAYLESGLRYDRALRELELAAQSSEADLREACRRILAHHASTRERLPLLDTFYADLFADLPPIRSVLDVACGLNPLSALWMPLAPDVVYYGTDLSQSQMAFLEQAFARLGRSGVFWASDAGGAAPTQVVDVAFVLKLLPVLEQSEKGSGARLLRHLKAKTLIVSYPTQSLGGRGKGMAENYAAQFEALAAAEGWAFTKALFPSELRYRVERGSRS